ncbi:hypothetical protein ACFXKG_12900 [Streptomyces sp. NPDC059255]|uniref:hypothetical protein n=1 Tax=Streptomyces sp. NPDC059255 TaxID=3346793 RepID=UPI00369DFC3A
MTGRQQNRVERGGRAGAKARSASGGGRALHARGAYPGITNGRRFIDNAFFAIMYCLAGVGFAAVPLLAWRRSRGRYADAGFGRTVWSPWLDHQLPGLTVRQRADAPRP